MASLVRKFDEKEVSQTAAGKSLLDSRPQLKRYKIKHGNREVTFIVESRYKPESSIGMGAYGVICSATDTLTGKQVAIKKMPDPFSQLLSAKRALREIKILTHFDHENIICACDFLRPSGLGKDIYIVLDLMQTDLQKVINSNQLTDDHIKYFFYQILKALKYIHSGNIVHRDLKPSNILVDENCNIKIGNFNLARDVKSQRPDFVCSRADNTMTEYIATQWYSAPELMMNVGPHTCALDVWSLGCIIAELINGKTLFPGTSYLNELQLILSVTGTPKKPLLERVQSEKVRKYIQSLPEQKRTHFPSLLPSAPKESISLLDKMLALDPEERITADTALKHRYLKTHHNPLVEAVCLKQFNFSFEKGLTSLDLMQKAALMEIKDFHEQKEKKSDMNDTINLIRDLLPKQRFSVPHHSPAPPRSKRSKDNPIQAQSLNSNYSVSPDTKRLRTESAVRPPTSQLLPSSSQPYYSHHHGHSPPAPAPEMRSVSTMTTRTIGIQTSPERDPDYERPFDPTHPPNFYPNVPTPAYPYRQDQALIDSPYLNNSFFPNSPAALPYYNEPNEMESIDIPYFSSSCNDGYNIGSNSRFDFIPNDAAYTFEPKLPTFPEPSTNLSSGQGSDCDPTTGQPDMLNILTDPTAAPIPHLFPELPAVLPQPDTSNSLFNKWLDSGLANPADLQDIDAECCYDFLFTDYY